MSSQSSPLEPGDELPPSEPLGDLADQVVGRVLDEVGGGRGSEGRGRGPQEG